MATIPIAQPRFLTRRGMAGTRTYRGGAEETGIIREDASQSWVAGDLIVFDSDGDLELAAGSEGTPGKIAGQATAAATGVTSADVFFAPISPLDIFLMNVYHGTIGSAVTNRNQLGVCYPIKRVSTKWVVDLESDGEDADSADARVRVIGFWDEDTLGDTYGRVKVEFLEYSLASDGNPNIRILQLA